MTNAKDESAVERGRMVLASLIAPADRVPRFTAFYPRVTNTPLAVECERRGCVEPIEIGERELENIDGYATADYDLDGEPLTRLYCSRECASASRFKKGVEASV